MSRLLSTALSLRRDPRVLKLPPYLSFLCLIIGVAWLLLLPLDEYSRKNYISENALLPGQVHTYFGGSEYHVLRAYRHEVESLEHSDNQQINDRLEHILKGFGVKVGRQAYKYHAAGAEISGENVYGLLQAPRGDATEAIVLIAAWTSTEGYLNRNGVALALTLARYFKRWSLWSKDIIIVFPPDSHIGTQAWVDAYHDAHDIKLVAPLPLKSGLLQGAIAIDYPLDQKFKAMEILYDGTNGQLPNLDLINSVVNIAGGQMGIHSFIQGMREHKGTYTDRLQTMLRGMLSQGSGAATGPHSSFIPYHIDAVTLQPFGQGLHDEMAMGRVVEGSFRSLNNLLEHLHQSFFFYLLMQKDRFVSIGTFLPSAMLLAANFSIMAIFLLIKSGQSTHTAENKNEKSQSIGALESPETTGKAFALPLGIVVAFHAVSAIPLYIFNQLSAEYLSVAFATFSILSTAIPFLACYIILPMYKPTKQHAQLTQAFSLLILGMVLSTLATLNFSLAFIVALLASPLSFVGARTSQPIRFASAALLNLISPSAVIFFIATAYGARPVELLMHASFGWNVWGMYTSVVVWAIWWPAWTLGMISTLGFAHDKI